jgi:hypothetical protein
MPRRWRHSLRGSPDIRIVLAICTRNPPRSAVCVKALVCPIHLGYNGDEPQNHRVQLCDSGSLRRYPMTHAQLVSKAVQWLRGYGCGIVLSEQACVSGEVPDAIGWKGACRSVLVECKVTRSDFLVDRTKPFRENLEGALGCERWYLTPAGLLSPGELPLHWGLVELRAGKLRVAVRASRRSQRLPAGLLNEMNLLLASLRRVEVRIEPQTITEFLKWKNRMAEYNGGGYPVGLLPPEQELNPHLRTRAADPL